MKIVILEREKLLREILMKTLQEMNPDYEIAGAADNGKDGYELICLTEPDLVILDTHMPKMDGLKILRRLRREGNDCKVLVLSEYSNFEYIKQAMELDAENYLLKPVKIPELKKAVQKAEKEVEKVKSLEKVYSISGIFLTCLNGQISPDKYFHKLTMERYGFSVEDPAEVFVLWLGEKYEEQRKAAKKLLVEVGEHSVKFNSCVLEISAWSMLIMILYNVPAGTSQYSYFQNSVMPMLCDNLKDPVICSWRSIDRMLDLPQAAKEMRGEREWNLLFGKGTLIRKEDIEKLEIVPLKHPTELEDRVCQAVKRGDWNTIEGCSRALVSYYQAAPHRPDEIKESIIRFNWTIASCYRNVHEINAGLQIQTLLQAISEAVSWSEINYSIEEIFRIIALNYKEGEKVQVSELVERAQQLILKYYDQGITLEEIADKLFVSVEHLSAQFKKQTGATFSETIRKIRIEKVKQLLRNSHLKLNQIAELVGYSDSKYMSRVFKEEVGMLPSEFRKLEH
ncbi:MAG: response regulator [Muricomes sp.]